MFGEPANKSNEEIFNSSGDDEDPKENEKRVFKLCLRNIDPNIRKNKLKDLLEAFKKKGPMHNPVPKYPEQQGEPYSAYVMYTHFEDA